MDAVLATHSETCAFAMRDVELFAGGDGRGMRPGIDFDAVFGINSKIMISDAGARRPNAAFLYVYVGDADSIYRRMLERGAASIEAPFDTPYGDLRCMVEDRWGNTFNARRCDP